MDLSRSTEFSHKTYIPVKTDLDEERCWITGMTLLNANKLILADSKNFSVKLVDINSYSVNDLLQLYNYPLDVTSVTDHLCAVTVPVQRIIQFMKVSSDKLLLTDQLEVDGDCRGISSHGEKLLVTYGCPAKVQIMDMNGNVLNTFATDPMEDALFSEPYYIVANHKCINISDQGRHAVVTLDWHGKQTCCYKYDGCPHGLAMLGNGLIFVCGQQIYIHDSRNEINIALKDLCFPYAVCWGKSNRSLYLSYHKGDADIDNYLQVFEKT